MDTAELQVDQPPTPNGKAPAPGGPSVWEINTFL
jgi:hypothetical protein